YQLILECSGSSFQLPVLRLPFPSRLVPVNLDVARGAPGRDDVGLLVAVEVADDQAFAVHAGIVDHLLGPRHALAIGDVDGQAERLPSPTDRELVVAVAVEVGPAER